MARQVRVEVIGDWDGRRLKQGSARDLGTLENRTKRTSGALKAAFATFTAGAVVVGIRATVDAASAMNETISKTRVVFGPAAKGVEDFAKTAARSMGLSRQEAMESAATFGNLFVSMKIGAPRAAEMSTRMIKLAGDLASFNNANPSEVLEALRSGLVGETEPLRRFGVNLTDAALRQEALRLGLVKTTKEVLPPAAKAQASYSLILQQTTTAQGDFSRTSGGLANQQRILAAQWKDMQASIGQVLLPAVVKGVGVFSDFLGVVDRNRKLFGILAGVIVGFVGIVGTLLAVQRAVKATTEAWGIAQAGLNRILGITKVQAVGTAAAEGALAAGTTASGVAATGASAGFSRLTASLGPIGLGLAALAIGYQVATTKARDYNQVSQNLTESTKRYGLEEGLAANLQARAKAARDGTTLSTHKAAEATKQHTLETKYNAIQQQDLQTQMAGTVQAADSNALSVRLLGKSFDDVGKDILEHKTTLQGLKTEYAAFATSVQGSIESFKGSLTDAKNSSFVTTSSVIGDLHNQVANFRTYSTDVQRLIRAGVNPAAIQELSIKGPQYVHALAAGSKPQIEDYKKTWVARNKEIRSDFAGSIAAQQTKLVQKIAEMNNQIAFLKGALLQIKLTGSVTFSGDAAQVLKTFTSVGPLGPVRRQAAGGLLPGYGGGDRWPALLEAGEAVVPKDKVKRPEFRSWAGAMGIPGFQRGGLLDLSRMGLLRAKSGNELYWGSKTGLTKGMTAALKTVSGTTGIKAFIRSTDALPYVWGAAGPGAYDCSGLVSAVLGKMTGQGGGHGQRYFTTDTIHPGILGLKSGLGGVLQIGVTPGKGHMAGRYGGLGFEAESTATGIKIGAAASRPESFARRFHLAKGGLVKRLDPRTIDWLARQPGIAIGGDPGNLRIDRYDAGGYLPPGLSMAYNGTGHPEPVGRAAGVTLEWGAVQILAAPGMDERRLAELAGVAVVRALDERDRRERKGRRA